MHSVQHGKNYAVDLSENFAKDVFLTSKNRLNFGSRASECRSRAHSVALRDQAFLHSLACISGETEQIFMKILS